MGAGRAEWKRLWSAPSSEEGSAEGRTMVAASRPSLSAQASAGLALIFKALEQQKNGIKKFRTLDLDGTGELSAFEFKKAVRAIGTDGGGDAALSPGQWQAVIKELGGDKISIQNFLDRAFVSKIEQVRRQIRSASITGEGMNWQKLFEDADTDRSGYLEVPEFINMLRRKVHVLPEQASDDDIKQMVLFMDDDRNGQIECQEFLDFLNQEDLAVDGESMTMKVAASVNEALQKAGTRMMDIFNQIDKAGTGELDEEKFFDALVLMGAKIARSEATLLMAAVDIDGGGTITADEFLNFLKKARGAAPERKPKKHQFEGGLSYKRWGGPGPPEHEGGSPRVTPRQSRLLADNYAQQVTLKFRNSAPSEKWSPTKPSPIPAHLPRVFAQMQSGPSPYTLLPTSSSDIAFRSCDMRHLETLAAKGNRGSASMVSAGALKLSEEELAERGTKAVFHVLRQAMAADRSLYGQKIKDARSVFETIDADKSGSLDHAEFEQGCARLGLGLTHEQVVDIIKYVDCDNNGAIEYGEFIEILNSVYDKTAPKKKNKKNKNATKKTLRSPIITHHSFTSYASGQDFVSVANDPSMVGVNKMLRQRALQEELSEPTAQKVALNLLSDFARDSLISPTEHRRIAQGYVKPSMAMRVSVKTREGLIGGWSSQQRNMAEHAEVLRARVGEKVAGLRYELQRDRHLISNGSLLKFTASPPSTARPGTVGSPSPRRGLSPRQPGAGLDLRGVQGGRCGPTARPMTAPMDFGSTSFPGAIDSDLTARFDHLLGSLPTDDSFVAAEKEKSRKLELEMAITKLRAEAAIEHGTAKGLVDQLSQLNSRAISEPDSKNCHTPVPLAPPEAAEQEALVQLKGSLEQYVAEQRAIAVRTREALEKEIEKQAAGVTDVDMAQSVLDKKSADAEAAGPQGTVS